MNLCSGRRGLVGVGIVGIKISLSLGIGISVGVDVLTNTFILLIAVVGAFVVNVIVNVVGVVRVAGTGVFFDIVSVIVSGVVHIRSAFSGA